MMRPRLLYAFIASLAVIALGAVYQSWKPAPEPLAVEEPPAVSVTP